MFLTAILRAYRLVRPSTLIIVLYVFDGPPWRSVTPPGKSRSDTIIPGIPAVVGEPNLENPVSRQGAKSAEKFKAHAVRRPGFGIFGVVAGEVGGWGAVEAVLAVNDGVDFGG